MDNSDKKLFVTRAKYDNCEYEKKLISSVASYKYQMTVEKFENPNKCVFEGKYTRPYDSSIVDVESDLMNISRLLSPCADKQYSPYRNNKNSISTYSKDAPVVIPAEICPITLTNDGRGFRYGKG